MSQTTETTYRGMTEDDLRHIGEDLYIWESYNYNAKEYDKWEDVSSLSYGDIQPIRRIAGGDILPIEPYQELVFMPRVMGGSDYSGTQVEKANHDAFMKEFGESEFVKHSYGGHGTYAIVLRADVMESEDETAQEIVDTLRSLADYPVMDEELLSEQESNAQDSAWSSWACSDFQKALEQRFNNEIFEIEWWKWQHTNTEGEEGTEQATRNFFEELREKANEYWVVEQVDSAYIRIEDVVKKSGLTLSELTGWLDENDVPYTLQED